MRLCFGKVGTGSGFRIFLRSRARVKLLRSSSFDVRYFTQKKSPLLRTGTLLNQFVERELLLFSFFAFLGFLDDLIGNVAWARGVVGELH